MKRILITGKNSYIGTMTQTYLEGIYIKEGEPLYRIDRISLRDINWAKTDFSVYNTVFHMAGIAHADIGHVTEEQKQQYYEVNCELAVRAAEKARREGVRQFVYMSSVIVYGDSAPVGCRKHIVEGTEPKPANFYGDSKYQAERRLAALQTAEFQVAIVRTPMVYGKGSRGNYPLLEKIAGKTPVFPSIQNQRSMIYIENLTEFLRLLADSGKGGLYHPQNASYVSTGRMVQEIARTQGRNIKLWSALNPFVRIAAHIPGKLGGMTNKAFGTLTIDQRLSAQGIDGYQKYGLEESIGRIHEDQCYHGNLQ